MNFAFPGIVLLILFTCGVILRRSYYSERFSKKYIRTDLVDEFVGAIIPGVFINIGCIYIFKYLFRYDINFEYLGYLVTGNYEKSVLKDVFQNIGTHLFPITLFFILSWVISFVLGRMAYKLVRFFKWDHKFLFLRFPNHWYYFFSGEYLEITYKDFNLDKDIDWLLFEIWTNSGGNKVKKYIGMIDDFILSKDGSLDTIYLLNPEELDDDSNADGQEGNQKTEIASKELNISESQGSENVIESMSYLMIPGKNIIKIQMWPQSDAGLYNENDEFIEPLSY